MDSINSESEPEPESEHEPEPEPEPETELYSFISPLPIPTHSRRSISPNGPFNLFNIINLMITPMSSLEERVLQESINEPPSYKKVSSKDFINSLSVQKVTQSMIEDSMSCALCMEEFKLNEDIIELPCKDKHYFHIKKETCEGIYPWLKENNSCPLCRFEFPFTEKKINTNPQSEMSHQEQGEQQPVSIHQFIDSILEEEEDRQLQEALLASNASSNES
jgi:hypothetical protein